MLLVEKENLDKLTESMYKMQKGERAEMIVLPDDYPDNEMRQLIDYFNHFVDSQNHVLDFIYALSKGELGYEAPKGSLGVLQPFKSLQASLKHLTWVTKQVASGDFNHKVDFMGEFSHSFNEMTIQLKDAFEEIQRANTIMSQDKDKIRNLLSNVLPDKTIKELEKNGRSAPMMYENVVVFMSDIVGFTNAAAEIDPVMLIDELNNLFSEFDRIVIEHGGERIKTIGDAFMAVWNMHIPLERASEKAVDAAFEMIEFLKNRNDSWVLSWDMRVGFHIGNVVGGIVGNSKFIYDVFGDAVNMAARMESNSEPMRINASDIFYDSLDGKYECSFRGNLEVKGKGPCGMYFINSRKEK